MTHCDRCTKHFSDQEGMKITSEDNHNYYFCKSCLQKAMHNLSLMKHKTVDQAQLLKGIRKFLHHVKN